MCRVVLIHNYYDIFRRNPRGVYRNAERKFKKGGGQWVSHLITEGIEILTVIDSFQLFEQCLSSRGITIASARSKLRLHSPRPSMPSATVYVAAHLTRLPKSSIVLDSMWWSTLHTLMLGCAMFFPWRCAGAHICASGVCTPS